MKKQELFLILHDMRSAHNVGAIFRSADGAGVSKIYLSGYTQLPAAEGKLNPTQAEKMLEKTALGAQNIIPWESVGDFGLLLESLRNDGCQIAALEKTDQAQDIRNYQAVFPLALILGNEVTGVDSEVLQQCDAVLSIPMRGKKESLNVSVAAGIAMYELLR